jgi:hypothetical protein
LKVVVSAAVKLTINTAAALVHVGDKTAAAKIKRNCNS